MACLTHAHTRHACAQIRCPSLALSHTNRWNRQAAAERFSLSHFLPLWRTRRDHTVGREGRNGSRKSYLSPGDSVRNYPRAKGGISSGEDRDGGGVRYGEDDQADGWVPHCSETEPRCQRFPVRAWHGEWMTTWARSEESVSTRRN
jgi:hypothetical protein